MQEYFCIEDIIYRDKPNYAYFTGLTISNNMKRHHNIDGWLCISGVLPDGRTIQLYDIWCGFHYKYRDNIELILLKTCQEIGVELK